jgi:hypothetical protein
MNATENLNGNSNNGMKLHEACEYMNMEPQELKDLLLQLGYNDALHCETVPTEYVAKLEEIKVDIEGATQPQQQRLPAAANDSQPQTQPQQEPGQLTLANALTIAQTHQVSLEVVLMMQEQIKSKNDALDIQEGYQEEQRSSALKNLGKALYRAQRYQQDLQSQQQREQSLAKGQLDVNQLTKGLGIDLEGLLDANQKAAVNSEKQPNNFFEQMKQEINSASANRN